MYSNNRINWILGLCRGKIKFSGMQNTPPELRNFKTQREDRTKKLANHGTIVFKDGSHTHSGNEAYAAIYAKN